MIKTNTTRKSKPLQKQDNLQFKFQNCTELVFSCVCFFSGFSMIKGARIAIWPLPCLVPFRHKEEIHPRNQESVCHLWAIPKAVQVIPTLGFTKSPGRIHQVIEMIRNDYRYPARKMNECALKREYHKIWKDFHLPIIKFQGRAVSFQ